MKPCTCRVLIVVGVSLFFARLHVRGEPLHFPADRPLDLRHIKLDLKVDLLKKHVSGTATLDLTALREVSSIRFNARDFDVTLVTLARGQGPAVKTDYINDGEFIEVLPGDHPLHKDESVTVNIDYSITDPETGLHFFAPSEAEPDIPHQVWSQGESTTNRYWVPCFDHPNEMQTTETIITVEEGNEVISNGRLISKKKNNNGTVTFHWLQDKPHVSYLMTLIVGKFYVEEDTWRGKPVRYYVPPDRRDDLKRSFANTPRMLEFFSNTFGVEYPWDQYAQICVEQFGGGMENTSATTLGVRTLHDQRAHLDFSSDGLVSHELGHQWFGDLVTCKDWAHLWLNEGFATYSTAIWFEHDRGRDEYEYQMYRYIQRGFDGGKKRPVVDRGYEHPRQMFDSRAYPKGASILHMLRDRLGDEVFWRGVKQYLTRYAHQPVETSDFRQVLEAVSGRSLGQFFYDWTQRPGAPSVDVDYTWHEDDSLVELVVTQKQDAQAFHFPLEMEFHFDESAPVVLRREVTEKKHRFLIPLKHHPTMVLIDPHQAVVMELSQNKGRDLWSAQLNDEAHLMSRIRAAKHFGKSDRDRDVELLKDALQNESFWGVGVEIAGALGKAGGEHARDALLDGLQHSHPKVRRECAEQLGSFHRDEAVVSALYALIRDGDPSYRVEAAVIQSYGKLQPDHAVPFLTTLLDRDSHREQIRSAVLRAIGDQPDASGLDVLVEWTRRGKPRFCRIAALSALSRLNDNVFLQDDQLERIVKAVTTGMKGEHRRVKRAAISTLRDLGEASRPALTVLRALQANDPELRIRDAAKKAIEKITAETPQQVQVSELREAVDELKKELDEIKDRLEKTEAMQESWMLEKGE